MVKKRLFELFMTVVPTFKAGDLDFSTFDLRGLRTNWLIVGIYILLCFFIFGDDTLGDSYHLCVLLQHLSARPCTLLRDQK